MGAGGEERHRALRSRLEAQAPGHRLRPGVAGQDHAVERVLPQYLEPVTYRPCAGLGGIARTPDRRIQHPTHLDARPVVVHPPVEAGPADEPARGPLLESPVAEAAE